MATTKVPEASTPVVKIQQTTPGQVVKANSVTSSKILDAIQPFIIGGLSGMFATCIIQPVDMIKVSIQLKSEEQLDHKKKISPFTVAGEIYKAEGIRGFYRGQKLANLELIRLQPDRFSTQQQGWVFTNQQQIIQNNKIRLLEEVN